MNSKVLLAGLTAAAMLGAASTAFAQSTVTGTLSSGGSNTTTTSGNTVTGTVTSGSSSGNTTTSSGGGGGGGSGSNIVDICPNLSGTQSTLPSGYVISNGNCVQNTSGTNTTSTGTTGTGSVTTGTSGTGSAVLGTSTGPNVPNTGAGGSAEATLGILALSAIAGIGGMRLLKARTA